MSGESMMQDNVKHIYHSIPMDVPGAVTMTEKSRCCGGSRKVMTLILASALLWVIVLDIMLVVYKSHHLVSSHSEHLDAPMPGAVVLVARPAGATPSVVDRNNSSSGSSPPNNGTHGSTTATRGDSNGHQSGDASQNKDMSKRDNFAILQGKEKAIPSLQDWLSRLRHKLEARPQAPSLIASGQSRPPPPAGLLPPSEPLLLRWRQRPFVGRPLWLPTRRYDNSEEPDAGINAPGRPEMPDGDEKFPLPELPAPQNYLGSEKIKPSAAPPESALLVRFFSAIVDAPWNLTSEPVSGRRLAKQIHAPRPRPPPPPPFLPSHFMNLLSHPDPNDDDDDDSDETVFDADL